MCFSCLWDSSHLQKLLNCPRCECMYAWYTAMEWHPIPDVFLFILCVFLCVFYVTQKRRGAPLSLITFKVSSSCSLKKFFLISVVININLKPYLIGKICRVSCALEEAWDGCHVRPVWWVGMIHD